MLIHLYKDLYQDIKSLINEYRSKKSKKPLNLLHRFFLKIATILVATALILIIINNDKRYALYSIIINLTLFIGLLFLINLAIKHHPYNLNSFLYYDTSTPRII